MILLSESFLHHLSSMPLFSLNSKEEQDVFNVLGIAYASALFLGLVNCSTLQPIVAMEKVVFYREKSSAMYSAMAYAIAQVSKNRC